MNESVLDWLKGGQGEPPRLGWSFMVDAPLVGMETAWETENVLAADETGGLYLLDQSGRIVTLTRRFQDITAIAWCDTGTAAAVILGDDELCLLNGQMAEQWRTRLHETILAVALAPYGQHIAISLADGQNIIYDCHRAVVSQFATVRPLSFLQFLATEPVILGAAEYGLLCCHALDGSALWNEKLWSNTGDMSATGDGATIYLAGFTYGVQVFDADGTHHGTYVLEGTPNHVSTGFEPRELFVTTLEKRIYRLDSAGDVQWTSLLPDDVHAVHCDPLGGGLVCGFSTGRILRLEWDRPAMDRETRPQPKSS